MRHKSSIISYNCLNCGTLHTKPKWQIQHQYNAKYCNHRCQAEYKWKNVTVPRIEAGVCRQNSTLKIYLIRTHGELCAKCKCKPIWLELSLVLQVDHIDGNNENCLPSNLQLLCPNCHSQTPNFGARGCGSKGRYNKLTKRKAYKDKYNAKFC